jgi:hypothetical protein
MSGIGGKADIANQGRHVCSLGIEIPPKLLFTADEVIE